MRNRGRGDAVPVTRATRKALVRVLAGALAIVLVNVILNAVALPHIDLPELPDFPGWLGFLLGTGKVIVIAVIIVLAVIGEELARRGGDDGDTGGDRDARAQRPLPRGSGSPAGGEPPPARTGSGDEPSVTA